ncbi:MAG: homoserine O-acetyltransferase [Firmicutes bacterium]|nr:homoserine O-acetyltransferase [Bacillota bacterium]
MPETVAAHPAADSAPLLVRLQRVTLFTPDRPLVLESGRTLAPVEVAFETYGRLTPERDNAVLICHALTGDSHVAGRYHPDDPRPGWWDDAVGPGKAIDTNRYFVICSNVLGGCRGTTGPSSLNPATGRPYGLDFPLITVRDMVRVQAALLDYLGIPRVLAVIGGSLGAMQAIEWAVTYPDRLLGVIPIAGAARLHPQGIAFNAVQRQAILNDPDFRGGQYYPGPGPVRGLALARMIGMITYRSDESMWHQFGRRVRPAHLVGRKAPDWDDGYGGRRRPGAPEAEKAGGTPPAASLGSGPAGAGGAGPAAPGDGLEEDPLERGFGIAFEVESYLHYNGEALVRRFDANSYLYLTRAMDLHDISRGYGSLAAAYRRVQAEALVVGIRSDLLFPTYLQKEMVEGIRAAGGRAEYLEMDSPWGHDAFLVDFHQIAGAVAEFLERQQRRARAGGPGAQPACPTPRPEPVCPAGP